ncbi:MAG: glycosyltransferase family 4 protein [bacterium]|nr:glycosyltransferase family 4 protein [bacterium]
MNEKTNEKEKILILSTAYLPHIGGSELAIKNITDRINDFEFHLITARLDKKSPEQEKMGNVFVFRVGGFLSLFKFFLPKTLLPLEIFLKASSLLKTNDYKLIHAFQASGAAGAGWLLKIFYPQLRFIITLQEGKDLERQGFLINFFRRLIIKKADSAIAISHYLKSYIQTAKKDLPVALIPNGVDLVNFSRQFSYGELTDLENDLDIKPDDRVVISVSRLVFKNGLDMLIEALALLNKKFLNQEYKLILVGEGPLKESLKFKVKSLKLEDKVIFTGSVGQDELPVYLKISDVFVRPSRSEGLGSAFLEAMASGIPVIGTRVGGIPDFLEDPSTRSTRPQGGEPVESTGSGQATGLFCTLEPGDIASKINIIFENSSLRQEIIKNSQLLVEEKYDWNKIAEEYRTTFKHLNI